MPMFYLTRKIPITVKQGSDLSIDDVHIDQEEFEELWVEKAEKVAAKAVSARVPSENFTWRTDVFIWQKIRIEPEVASPCTATLSRKRARCLRFLPSFWERNMLNHCRKLRVITFVVACYLSPLVLARLPANCPCRIHEHGLPHLPETRLRVRIDRCGARDSPAIRVGTKTRNVSMMILSCACTHNIPSHFDRAIRLHRASFD